jgi:hypothetical protein
MSSSEESAMNDRITIEGQDGAFGAYIARPKTLPAPAVVVLHEVYLPLLKHAQQRDLRLHRNVADLVEKDGPGVCHLEAAAALLHGTGEGALLVAEELGGDQRRRNGRAVDADEDLRDATAF